MNQLKDQIRAYQKMRGAGKPQIKAWHMSCYISYNSVRSNGAEKWHTAYAQNKNTDCGTAEEK